MSKLLRSFEFTLVASAVILAGITALAYSKLGFLGVTLVGLLLLFMSVQSDLQKNGARRSFESRTQNKMELMARDSEGQNMQRFWKFSALAGAALFTVGLAGFSLLQLPS